MGMNKGWVSPTVPFGAIGLQDYALCFWSTHATLFSWLFRFAASALGYAAGQWIGSNTDSATLVALASSEQVPTSVRTLVRVLSRLCLRRAWRVRRRIGCGGRALEGIPL